MSDARDESDGELKTSFGANYRGGVPEFNASIDFKKKLKETEAKRPEEEDEDVDEFSRKGIYDGEKLHPPYDAAAPENLINSPATSERQIYIKFFEGVEVIQNRFRLLNLWLEDCTPKRLNADNKIRWFKNVFDQSVASYRANKNSEPTKAEYVKTEFERTKELFEKFRDSVMNSGQLRDPKIPTERSTMMAMSVLVTALVVETIINGMAFSEVMAGALMQGASIALAISAFNIFSGFFSGHLFLRHALSSQRFRYLNIGLFVLTFFFVLFINLLIAHKREHLGAEFEGLLQSTEVNTPSMQELANLLILQPLEFNDLAGLVLLIVGLMAFLIACMEGYFRFSDPIPGYADVFKNHKAAESLWLLHLSDNERKLTLKSFEGFIEYFVSMRNHISYEFDIQDLLCERMKSNFNEFRSALNAEIRGLEIWRSFCMGLVQAYRSNNEIGRNNTKRRMSGVLGRVSVRLLLHNKAVNSSNIDVLAQPPAYFAENVVFEGVQYPEIEDESHFYAIGWGNVEENKIERDACEKVLNNFLAELRKMKDADWDEILELSERLLRTKSESSGL
ncbi:MAG: hypothetical protein AAF557_19565 [Pseudomonadota bacterium]